MALAPRVVVVYRRSELDELTERHATRGQVEFFLKQRGQTLAVAEVAAMEVKDARQQVGVAVPPDWRRTDVERDDLAQFLFGPEDIIAVVGRDGLVANVAKYVTSQPVVGFNPFPHANAGVLTPFSPELASTVLQQVFDGQAYIENRTMVRATSDDGQKMIGLNDVYLGDRGHQSARYQITTPNGGSERHSSSGVIVGTGTGATGWLSSLAHDRAQAELLPLPHEPALAWFAREAWPSPFTGVEFTEGVIMGVEELEVTIESEELIVFGDGIESDHISVTHGQRVEIGVAERRLRLVQPFKDPITLQALAE